MNNITLGSLFDGSGGFPLGGLLAGIEPVWASEIEPFPIRVTTKRLPFMKHYGNVSEMDGGKIEPVDIITFGSPCQDMSVAGKRAGLDGSRSNLFYEAIRIVKEMRQKTNGKYPRYIVWENVPGAFSSNKGEDFRCVLESICHIKDEELSVPRPAKWTYAGEIMGDGFSVAWRQLDAQFWGVPQRRKRIYLVADFAGGSAGEILFESEGLSGYSPQGFRAWQATLGNSADRSGTTGTIGIENHAQDSRYRFEENGTVQTLTSCMGTGGNNVPLLLISAKDSNAMKSSNPHSGIYKAETTRCLDANGGNPSCNQGGMAVVALEGNGTRPSHKGDGYKESDVMYTLNATEQHGVAHPTFSSSRASFFTDAKKELADTLVAMDYKDPPLINDTDGPDYIVRRLTPTECARLQGFPDWWCSNLATEHPTSEEVYEWYKIFETHRKITGSSTKPKTEKQIRAFLTDPHSDSAEYKMWGNGVALPCVYFVLSGIVWAIRKLSALEEVQIMNACKIIADSLRSRRAASDVAIRSMSRLIYVLTDMEAARDRDYEGEEYIDQTKAALARVLRDLHILADKMEIRAEVVNRAEQMAEKSANKILKKAAHNE